MKRGDLEEYERVRCSGLTLSHKRKSYNEDNLGVGNFGKLKVRKLLKQKRSVRYLDGDNMKMASLTLHLEIGKMIGFCTFSPDGTS